MKTKIYFLLRFLLLSVGLTFSNFVYAQQATREYANNKKGFEFYRVKYEDGSSQIEDKNGNVLVPKVSSDCVINDFQGVFQVMQKKDIKYFDTSMSYRLVSLYSHFGELIFDVKVKGFETATIRFDSKNKVYWLEAYKNKKIYVIDSNGEKYFDPINSPIMASYDFQRNKLSYSDFNNNKFETHYSKIELSDNAYFSVENGSIIIGKVTFSNLSDNGNAKSFEEQEVVNRQKNNISEEVTVVSQEEPTRELISADDGLDFYEITYPDQGVSIEDVNGKIIVPKYPAGYLIDYSDGCFEVSGDSMVRYFDEENVYPVECIYTFTGEKLFDAKKKGYVTVYLQRDRKGVYWLEAYKGNKLHVIDVNGNLYFPPFRNDEAIGYDPASGKLCYFDKNDNKILSQREIYGYADCRKQNGIWQYTFENDLEKQEDLANSTNSGETQYSENSSKSRVKAVCSFISAFTESLLEGLVTINNLNNNNVNIQSYNQNVVEPSASLDFESKFKRDFIEYYIQKTGTAPSEKVINEIWHQYLESPEDDEIDFDHLCRERHNKITQKTIEHKKNRYGDKKCHDCKGTGECSVCHGKKIYLTVSGYEECYHCMLNGINNRTGKCPRCLGKGTVFGIVNP